MREESLFILKEDMDDIIGIVKSLENSGLLIDGESKRIKEENKNAKFFLLLWHLWLLCQYYLWVFQ